LGPQTHDEGLASLRVFPQLAELDLRSCAQLTNGSLATITQVATLRVVWLPRHLAAGFSDAIRRALPNCEIRQ